MSDQNLQREHKTYLAGPFKNVSEDSVSYFKAKYYLQYFNDSLFLTNYSISRNIFNKDTDAFNLASIAFLTSKKRDDWFAGYSFKDSISSLVNSIRFMYMVSKNPVAIDVNNIPEKLQPDFLFYKKYYPRKPIVAAALSTVIPGLGEVYAGKKRSFVAAFVSNIAYAAQAYEAYHKLGIKNPFTIFSVGFFGVFYFSNIYGSYYDVKQVKKERKKQFLIDAADYFNINNSSKLYE